MKKVLFVATVVKKHINVFHVPFLKMFKNKGWETSVAARNDFDDDEECKTDYCDNYYNIPFCRNPLSQGNIKAYMQLKKIIDNNNYDIIHCHTPVGGLLARLASVNARRKGTRVIYTAHGFHFYKGAPLINWIIFYPIERFCSRFTDTLITINKEDYDFAKSHMKATEIKYVPSIGIDISKFSQYDNVDDLKLEFKIDEDDFVLLSVGELTPRKNHKVVIKALSIMKHKKVKYLICGNGELESYLKKMVNELNLNNVVQFLGFRNDVNRIYKCANAFVFPSLQEGLPVSLMEAMASCLPCVGLNIRGNSDLIKTGQNGYFVYKNEAKQYATVLDMLVENKNSCEIIGKNAHDSLQPFSKEIVQKEMYNIYFR